MIHVIVHGVNVGAQSYFDALRHDALAHARHADHDAARLDGADRARGARSFGRRRRRDDEAAIGGFERIMGPNGEAQYFANDLADAYRILYEHYRYTFVRPRRLCAAPVRYGDSSERSICEFPCRGDEAGFETVGEIFDDARNPGRKRPYRCAP